ncbi:MAG TPA: DNA recombination/repair protein RecA, partial [Psychrobacter sp.]|nr:DNA recombination/repair protein RecA [Psychrobacter sp.]
PAIAEEIEAKIRAEKLAVEPEKGKEAAEGSEVAEPAAE